MMIAGAAIRSTRVRMPRCSRGWNVIELELGIRFEDAIGSWDKFVSCAVDRQKMLRIGRIALQLLPELENLVVDCPRSGIAVVAPDFIEKLFAAEYPLCILGKEL